MSGALSPTLTVALGGFVALWLILGLWAWRKPGSLVPRGKWRLALAIVLAAAQVVGGIALVYAMVQAIASA